MRSTFMDMMEETDLRVDKVDKVDSAQIFHKLSFEFSFLSFEYSRISRQAISFSQFYER